MAERPKLKDQISILTGELEQCRARLESLARSEQMYRELIEGTDELVMRVDERGCLTYINRIAARIIGMAPEQLIGRSAFDFVHPEDRPNNRMAFEGWIHDTVPGLTFENRIVNQVTDRTYCMLWTLTLHYDKNGQFRSMNCIGKDLTRRKESELELKQLTHQLHERVKELNCLFELCRIREKHAFSLDDIIQGVIELIPASMQYPEITCVRVTFDGYAYQTDNFKSTEWKIERMVKVNGEPVCTLEVVYLETLPECRSKPFLDEEQRLVSAIAEQLGTIIEREWAEIELRKHREHLETLLNTRTAELARSKEQLNAEIHRRLTAEKALLEAETEE